MRPPARLINTRILPVFNVNRVLMQKDWLIIAVPYTGACLVIWTIGRHAYFYMPGIYGVFSMHVLKSIYEVLGKLNT